MHRIAQVISDEARAKHHDAIRRGLYKKYLGLTFWSPNINIFRDPRWGRGQETFGECPYLTLRLGVAFVKGLQGDDEKYLKVVTTPKHYAVHSGPEQGRHAFDARADERDLRETYLPAFEACVREGRAYSVMGAYNRTNGEPCCASPTLLEQILRQEWGFEGYVVSDCWAIRDIYRDHKVVDTAEEAAAMAVKAGCDLNCGITYPALLSAIEQQMIDEATIDKSVKRLFTARFLLGMFDPPEVVPYAQIPFTVNDAPSHRALALEAARESIVLLKNEGGLLPLKKTLEAVAVVGPHADELGVLLGNYNGMPSHAPSILEGIRQKVSPTTRVYHARGCAVAEGFPLLDPIPPAYLRPRGGDAGAVGLAAAYYDNLELEGAPAVERIDPLVDFVWKGTTPVSGHVGDPFSARWEGTFTPPLSGTYQLGVKGCTGYRLYLGDEVLVELEQWYSPTIKAVEVDLEAGRLYDLRLEYKNERPDHDPQIQLLWSLPGSDALAHAIEVARKADVVLMVLGLSSALEGEEMPIEAPGFQGGDRTDLVLPAPQTELLRRIHALGKPTVLILLSGSALAVNWAAEHVPAIVQTWYPGQAAGSAIADVLFGDYNPAGRLPVTFYKSVDDLPPFEDYRMAGRTYRYFEGEPLFPFGYGLSYTTFAYRDLTLSADAIALESGVESGVPALVVSVTVENTGERAGDEVVQLYLKDIEASVPVPRWQLAGFQRIYLEPGASRELTFHLTPRQLSLIDDEEQRVIEQGSFQIAVGGGLPGTAQDGLQRARFTVETGGTSLRLT